MTDTNEKTAAPIPVNKMVPHALDQVHYSNRASNDLAQWVEQYVRYSLSGSFIDQLGRTFRLLSAPIDEDGQGRWGNYAEQKVVQFHK